MRHTKEGLEILLALHRPGRAANVSAEHDVIYASGPPPDEIPGDVLKKLTDELHWHWDESLDSWVKYT